MLGGFGPGAMLSCKGLGSGNVRFVDQDVMLQFARHSATLWSVSPSVKPETPSLHPAALKLQPPLSSALV